MTLHDAKGKGLLALCLLPFCLLTLLISFSQLAGAQVESEAVKIDAWARATPPGARSAAVYGVMVNEGDALMEVKKIIMPLARYADTHETWLDNDMMRMRHITLALAPGERVTLAPGGLHIMLMGMKEPLERGCTYPFDMLWADGRVTRHSFVTGSRRQSSKPKRGRPCSLE